MERVKRGMTHTLGSPLPRPLAPVEGGPAAGADAEVGRPDGETLLFGIAGLTVAVTADMPLGDGTFAPKFRAFRLYRPEGEVVRLHHHLGLPAIDAAELGEPVLERVPWAIYRRGDDWIYVGVSPTKGPPLHRVAAFSEDHMSGRIYSPLPSADAFTGGGFGSLTLFPTDQIVLARVLAERQACYLHSSAVVMDGSGLLFVGHSGAGKSTTVRLVGSAGEVLCDDRNIIRRWPDGFRVHGSWSHGEVPTVSSASAPLAAILFLRQAPHNRLVELAPREAATALATCVVKPLVTADWWRMILELVEHAVAEVPCYALEFDTSGRVVPLLRELASNGHRAGRQSPAGESGPPG